MMSDELDKLVRDWARLGLLFGVEPADQPPAPELLIVRTAVAAPDSARLFIAAVTWLRLYGGALSADRLRTAAADVAGPAEAILALLIETSVPTQSALRSLTTSLRPAAEPGPLFQVERATPALRERARRRASPESIRWGVWCEPVVTKLDAIRPAAWVGRMNPALSLCPPSG